MYPMHISLRSTALRAALAGALAVPAAASAAPKPPEGSCDRRPVIVARFGSQPAEVARLRLVRCDGSPNEAALPQLSILARPNHVDRPSRAELHRFDQTASPSVKARFVARDIMRLHPGLLPRLAAVAERFPGRRIELISGYRPDARRTSRHRHGRALDIRIVGVHRRRVSEFARSLKETGVGFYPNSLFTHIDVRQRQAYWIDRSGPGEPADYGPWPPEKDEGEELREATLAQVDEALRQLDTLDLSGSHEPDDLPERSERELQREGADEGAGTGGVQAEASPSQEKDEETGGPMARAAVARPAESGARPGDEQAPRPAAEAAGRSSGEASEPPPTSRAGQPTRVAMSATEGTDATSGEGANAAEGIVAASGVLAAWSSVPGEDEANDDAVPCAEELSGAEELAGAEGATGEHRHPDGRGTKEAAAKAPGDGARTGDQARTADRDRPQTEGNVGRPASPPEPPLSPSELEALRRDALAAIDRLGE
jgi:hypothetical protein